MELFYLYFRVQTSTILMCEMFLGWNVFLCYMVSFKCIGQKVKSRIGNSRCECGSSQRLNRVVECVCCAEIDCVVAKNNEAVEAAGLGEPPVCITQHPGFHAAGFYRWHGTSISNNTKIFTKAHLTNKIDT